MGDRRYYGLDALRGVMMLLGIVIHAAMFYTVMESEVVPIKDRRTSPLRAFGPMVEPHRREDLVGALRNWLIVQVTSYDYTRHKYAGRGQYVLRFLQAI